MKELEFIIGGSFMKIFFRKKSWVLFLILALTNVLAACGAGKTADEEAGTSAEESSERAISEQILDDGVLDVAISGTFYPNGYYDSDNNLVGYNVDILNETAERLDVEIEYMEVEEDSILSAVKSGQVDIAGEGLSPTNQQTGNFLLSEPIKHSVTSIVVREEDDSDIHSLADFEGKKAAGEASTPYMEVAAYLGAESVIYGNATNDQYFMDVANGRTDFIPNDYYIQLEAMKQYNDLDVKMGHVVYNPTTSHFIYDGENTALRDTIDEVLIEMLEDGTMEDISEEYYEGEDVSVQKEEFNGIPVSELPVIDPEASDEENQAEIEKSIKQSELMSENFEE